MQKFIHHIRKQPEHVRRHILHVTMVICGVILSSIWIYSLGRTFTDSDTQTKIINDLKPFSALKDNLVGGFNSLSNQNSATVEQSQ